MKTEEVLKEVQKMYRGKRFKLDDDKENIIEKKYHSYERGGEYFSDDTYTETRVEEIHFCTVEFARRLLKVKPIRQNRLATPKRKPRLKIFGKLVTQ